MSEGQFNFLPKKSSKISIPNLASRRGKKRDSSSDIEDDDSLPKRQNKRGRKPKQQVIAAISNKIQIRTTGGPIRKDLSDDEEDGSFSEEEEELDEDS